MIASDKINGFGTSQAPSLKRLRRTAELIQFRFEKKRLAPERTLEEPDTKLTVFSIKGFHAGVQSSASGVQF